MGSGRTTQANARNTEATFVTISMKMARSKALFRRTVPGPFQRAAVAILLLIPACRTDDDVALSSSAPEPTVIAVTSYPLLVMAQELAGEHAEVQLVTEDDVASPDWKPTNSGIHQMQGATKILISGGDFEPWLQRVTIPKSRLVDTADGYYDQFIRISDALLHQHGPEGAHSHPGVVWTTWLDPQLAQSQLDRVREVLVQMLPHAASDIHRVADKRSEQLEQLEQRLEQLKQRYSDVRITGDAPVYQYLTRRLGWKLDYAHWPTHGSVPDEQKAELQQLISEDRPQLLLIQSDHMDDLGDVGVPVCSVDLCIHAAGDADFWQRLEENLTRLEAAAELMSPAAEFGRPVP